MHLVYRALEGDPVPLSLHGKVIPPSKRKLKLSSSAPSSPSPKGLTPPSVSSSVLSVTVSYKFVKCARKLAEWHLNLYLRTPPYSGQGFSFQPCTNGHLCISASVHIVPWDHKASRLSPATVVLFHVSDFIRGQLHGVESVQVRVAIVGVEGLDCGIMMVSNNCRYFFFF